MFWLGLYCGLGLGSFVLLTIDEPYRAASTRQVLFFTFLCPAVLLAAGSLLIDALRADADAPVPQRDDTQSLAPCAGEPRPLPQGFTAAHPGSQERRYRKAG